MIILEIAPCLNILGMKGHKNNSGKQKRKSHSCNTAIMQYIPKPLPKIIRGTVVSDETQGATRE